MTDDPQGHLYQLFERVGKLTGQVSTLHQTIVTSMAASQQRDAASSERIEGLERRMAGLESDLVTRADFKELTSKVDSLLTDSARQRGGTSAVGAISAQGAAWAGAVAGLIGALIALLALINSGRNTREIIRQEQRLPAPAPAPAPVVQPR